MEKDKNREIPNSDANKKTKDSQMSKKSNKKPIFIALGCILVAIVVCVLLSIAGVAYSINEANKREDAKSIYQKVGVVEYDILYGEEGLNMELNSEVIDSVNYYYREEDKKYFQYISYYLSNSQILDIVSDSEKNINVVIDTSLTSGDFELPYRITEEMVVENFSDFILSGNNIYVIGESTDAFSNVSDVYDELVAGVVYAELFNLFEDAELEAFYNQDQNYDLNSLKLLESYVTEVGFSKQESGIWEHPNSDIISEYRYETSVCTQLSSPIQTIICEISLYNDGQTSLIAENIIETIDLNFEVSEDAKSTAINNYDRGDDYYPTKAALTRAPFDFTSYDNSKFTDSKYSEIADSVSYYKVTSAQLENLKKQIENDGWEYVRRTENKNNEKFSAAQFNLVYEKESVGIKSQLIIRAMNTKGLGSDCIVQGFVIYCNNDSIYKNSGYLLEVLVGQYSQDIDEIEFNMVEGNSEDTME